MGAEHLLERGFERFGFCGYKGEAWSKRREDAFVGMVQEKSSEPCSLYHSTWQGRAARNWEDEQQCIVDWLHTLTPPFAVMACNDIRGQQVIDACLRFGMARLCPPTIEQIGTEAGIDTPQEYFDEVIAEYTERRNVMVDMLRQMPGVVAPMPKGAFYLVVKLPVDDADKFAQWLLTDFNVDNETVMIAPANGFYSTPGLGKDEVRIAYVLNVDDIKKSMHILAEALQKYPGRTV